MKQSKGSNWRTKSHPLATGNHAKQQKKTTEITGIRIHYKTTSMLITIKILRQQKKYIQKPSHGYQWLGEKGIKMFKSKIDKIIDRKIEEYAKELEKHFEDKPLKGQTYSLRNLFAMVECYKKARYARATHGLKSSTEELNRENIYTATRQTLEKANATYEPKKKKIILTINVESWGEYKDIKEIYEKIGSEIPYDELHFHVKH